MQTYTVQRGDTLYGISKQFGVSVDEIKKANNLSNNTISVGQTLNIPTFTTTYIVKKGDSLYQIAKNNNTTVDEIKRLNNLTSNILLIGQILRLPGSSVAVPDNYVTYTVQKGDSLYSIARNHNTTVDELKRINNLVSDNLSIGQQLFVPGTNNDGTITPPVDLVYIVQKGDSLYSIAQKFNISVEEIMRLNNLTSTVLQVGQVLKVTQGSSPDFGKECVGTGYIEPKYETYVVKKGDSLYVIAKRFNTSVDNIKKLNNLTSNNLDVGQVLKIREIG